MARPRVALLDRERIANAAMAIVDETGDFTVPAIARSLNVQTSSIYHHVDGRAGVIELLREKVVEEMDFGQFGGLDQLDQRPWQANTADFARSYRAAFAAHPRLVPILATTTVRAPLTISAYERVIAMLHDAGFSDQDSLSVVTAIENFIIGSALDLAAPAVMWEIPDDAKAPELARALEAAPHGAERAERAFEVGLAALLAGFTESLLSG
ncbi:TetR/AcrR family transcriptional regulator [Streptomyces coffeae]|uniref:TetR/AcrR family transcriptional regulator C-terminal domain-containing protein n=1 Tax=Streptomyces coffeae TaxID=621382 RepID=A0ABS1ND49_9ACTN|nr:TetR/AcrR family transcriptional regulator C-terminal domain-containing protein [Streptomyces coffeae]MBL1097845.1 TetR/AcrR family transcriptional regulator C-terminal domain-containing protein [Streptomyces coffeae]